MLQKAKGQKLKSIFVMDTAHYGADCFCIHLARIGGKFYNIGCAQFQFDSAETSDILSFPYLIKN